MICPLVLKNYLALWLLKSPLHLSRGFFRSFFRHFRREFTLRSSCSAQDTKLQIATPSLCPNAADDCGMIRKNPKSFIRGVVIPALLLLLAQPASAQESMTVGWKRNPEGNIAGYKVHLGTSSGSYPTVKTVMGGTTTVLTGLKPDTTYFCTVQAYDIFGQTSDFSSEISFTTRPLAGFLGGWTTHAGLRAAAADPMAVPFRDGVPNLLKYAFRMNGGAADNRVLAAADGTAGLPLFRLDRTAGNAWFEVQYLRLRSGELAYKPMVSTDLVRYTAMTGSVSTTVVDDVWERVTQRMAVNTAETPRLFGRVVVSQVKTPASVFADWAAAYGLSGTNSIAHGDGVPNLLKYAFNLAPSSADARILQSATGMAGLPRFSLAGSASQRTFTVEYLRRKNSGLVYAPKVSTNMVHYALMSGSVSVSSIDNDWERVKQSMAVNPALTPRLFGRVEVLLP
jgi:hypothetical protein